MFGKYLFLIEFVYMKWHLPAKYNARLHHAHDHLFC